MDIVYSILGNAGTVLYYTWWLWIFIIFWPIFEGTWLFWRQEVFKHEMEWVLLELRMPREVKKSPKAMEQVLAAMHALRNAPGDFKEKWIDGEVTRWFSLELVSLGGEVHFYLRTYAKQRPLVEAAFFSYYPDVEIIEVDDYVEQFPENTAAMFRSGYDLWGSEIVLSKNEAYPIKSYLDFESPDEDKQYDPISIFLEVLGKVRREEVVAIQYLIAPTGDKWRKEGEHIVDELRSKSKPGGGGHGAGAKMGMEFPHILPAFPVEKHDGKDAADFSKLFMRTPGETDVLKAIEENLSKPAFKTVIRFIYLSPKELYFDTFARRGVLSAFNQYAAMDLNSFTRNEKMSTRTKIWSWPHIFPGRRLILRKERLLHAYKEREISPETEMGRVIMSKFLNWENSEEIILTNRSLATLFHPPTTMVLTAPHVRRVESRKAGPPAGLPIYGGEEEVEKYR